MRRLRVGALCAGYGGLDLALADVLDVELVWYAEKDPAAAKVLALRFPGVPNLGDITEVDWSQVEPVDIVTAGFPCQDVSLAGRRAGIAAGTRSGLWLHIAKALAVLRPSLVMLENVRGLLSARAHSDVEPCPWCLGDDADEPVLRALGCVLGDLAELGLDAEWVGLRAADVGACHGRFRVGVLAWPAADAQRGERERELHPGWRSGGREAASGRGSRPAAHAQGDGRDEGWPEPAGLVGGPDAAERRPAALADAGHQEWPGGDATERAGAVEWPTEDAWSRGPARRGGVPAADPDGATRGWIEPGSIASGPAEGPRSEASRRAGRGGGAPAGAAAPNTDGGRRGTDERQLRERQPDAAGRAAGDPEGVGEPDEPLSGTAPGLEVEPVAGAVHRDRERGPAEGVHELGRAASELAWGPYEPAIRRWELTLGRPAPAPTEPGTKGQPRLSPAFVEWMQGLPEGWVTDVPDLSRNDQLRILGNGVVPQQFSAAIRFLLDRAFGVHEAPPAWALAGSYR